MELPYKGHKSVTLTDENVKRYEEVYYTDIKKYRAMGLTSFSKFIQYVLDRGLEKIEESH